MHFFPCSLLVLSGSFAVARTLKTVQGDVLHFQSPQAGPFIPLVRLSLGNPPQAVTAILDTGSSDLVVPQTGSAICKDPAQQCSDSQFVSGSFDPTKSSDVAATNVALNTSFANGVTFQGSFLKTTVTLGGNATIPNSQIGLIANGSLPRGTPLFTIFGVGPVQGEAAPPPGYLNLPAHMKEVGITKTNSFGLYTNDFRGGNGSIVFGGVDKAKFSGSLKAAPILTDNAGTQPSFVVEFSSLKLIMGEGRPNAYTLRSAGPRVPAVKNLVPQGGLPPSLIDSGNPGIDIPAESVRLMAKALGATFSKQNGMGPIDCSLATNKTMLVFGFNQDKAKIQVPLDLLVVPSALTNAPGCQLPIGPSQDIASLGSPFLQAAYVVFDMDQRQLSFAQAILNATGSSIEEMPGSSNAGNCTKPERS